MSISLRSAKSASPWRTVRVLVDLSYSIQSLAPESMLVSEVWFRAIDVHTVSCVRFSSRRVVSSRLITPSWSFSHCSFYINLIKINTFYRDSWLHIASRVLTFAIARFNYDTWISRSWYLCGSSLARSNEAHSFSTHCVLRLKLWWTPSIQHPQSVPIRVVQVSLPEVRNVAMMWCEKSKPHRSWFLSV